MVSATTLRVRSLSDVLGLTQDEVASLVGASPRTISRWWSGATTPQRSKQKRLRELAYVAEEIAKVLEPAAAREWLFSPSRQLDHDSPADRIARGDFRSVLALIDAIADGVFF